MRTAALVILLAAGLFAAPDPSRIYAESAVMAADGGSDLYVYAKIYNAEFDAYVVTVSWSAGDQAGTVTRLVPRSEFDTTESGYRTRMRVFIPASRESVKVTFLKVVPVKTGPAAIISTE